MQPNTLARRENKGKIDVKNKENIMEDPASK
jgi:hypothetical protein